MARIKPSQREKKRYIVFRIDSEEVLSFDEVMNALTQACLRFIGEFGFEKTRLFVIRNMYEPESKRGIFRVTNKSIESIKMILPLIDSINGKKARMSIIGVSGILKKAKNKFLINRQ